VQVDDRGAREILDRASCLTVAELSALGIATDHAMGWGMLRRDWVAASRSACNAAAAAGRAAIVEELADDAATDAVFVAVSRYAQSRGRDPQPMRAALDAWRRAANSGHRRRRRRAFRRLQRALSHAVGWRAARRVGSAVAGTAAAITALATQDLATVNGPYTREAYERLIGPWRTTIGWPHGGEDNLWVPLPTT
jgi:DNA-binding SARP family transcriptional activator